jgi:predicted anti-sigma-YlaC factor YlaD
MHPQYTTLMSLVLDREATPEQETQLRSHTGECRACAVAWAQWRVLDRRLAMAPTVAPPPTLLPSIMARLGERSARPSRGPLLASSVLLLWAGIAALFWCLVLGLLWWGYSNPVALTLVVSSATQVIGHAVSLLMTLPIHAGELQQVALPLGVALALAGVAALVTLWVLLLLGTGTVGRKPVVEWGRGR